MYGRFIQVGLCKQVYVFTMQELSVVREKRHYHTLIPGFSVPGLPKGELQTTPKEQVLLFVRTRSVSCIEIRTGLATVELLAA